MNLKVILILLLTFPFVASAQQTQTPKTSSSTKGVFLDISGGASLPLGAYTMSDATNEQSGFSNTGFTMQLGCDAMGKNNFGLGFQYTFQVNPLKNTSKDVIVTGMSVPLGSGDWTNHYIMAGPVFMKYFGKILFEAKTLIGIILATSPLFKTQDPAFNSVSSNTGTGIALGVGVGVGYPVSPTVALKLNAQYLFGNPKIDRQYGAQVIGHRDSAFVYSAPVTFDTKKVVSAFNLGLSIVIRIPG